MMILTLIFSFITAFSTYKTEVSSNEAFAFKLKTIKIKSTQMSCEGCKKSISDSLNKVPGVRKVNIDLKKKIITVDFEDNITNEKKILNAILETGYEAELIE